MFFEKRICMSRVFSGTDPNFSLTVLYIGTENGSKVWYILPTPFNDLNHSFSCFELPVPVFRFRADPGRERGGKVANSRLVLRVYEVRYMF